MRSSTEKDRVPGERDGDFARYLPFDAGFDAVRGVGAEMEVVAADLRIPVRGRTFVVKVFEVEGDVFEPVAEHQVRLFV